MRASRQSNRLSRGTSSRLSNCSSGTSSNNRSCSSAKHPQAGRSPSLRRDGLSDFCRRDFCQPRGGTSANRRCPARDGFNHAIQFSWLPNRFENSRLVIRSRYRGISPREIHSVASSPRRDLARRSLLFGISPVIVRRFLSRSSSALVNSAIRLISFAGSGSFAAALQSSRQSLVRSRSI